MARRTQKNVGVVGLGIIGSRVAESLRRRGYQVFVWNRTPKPFPNFVGSPSELADLCDFIQIFVSDDEALLSMVQQMKQSLKAPHVVMAHSTVAPHTMRAAAEIVQRRGGQLLDAPFTGSKLGAEKAELVYYVAGDEVALRRARPILEASSKDIIEFGEIGQATTIKVATNMVTAASVQAAAEALALVHAAGVAPDRLAAAFRGNASYSGTLALKLPNMIAGEFEPHFSVKHMLKDVEIASRLGRSHGLAFGATEAARDSLREEAARGHADDDYAALIRAFFPEGLPWMKAPEVEDDEQQTLAGLDEEGTPEEAAREAPVESKSEEPAEEPPVERSAAEEKPEAIVEERPEPAAAAQENGAREVESPSRIAEAAESTDEAATPAEAEEVSVDEAATPAEAEEGSADEAEPERPAIETPPAAEEEPEPANAAAATEAAGEQEEARRTFLRRIFGRTQDY